MADRTIVAVGDLTKFTEQLIRRLVLDVTANFVEANPLDTGWSRANWVPRIGAPFAQTAGTREEAERGQVSTALQQGGLAVVAGTYTLDQGPVFITNNVRYVPRLNEGSSPQAEAGWIEREIFRAVREL